LKSNYLYLVIDLLCLFSPLLASLWFKSAFYKTWKALAIAIFVPAIIFIAWDELFTRLEIWGFNPDYITGWTLGSLPLEEVLFFICIPYACLFTYFAFKYVAEKKLFFSHHELVSYAIIIVLLIAGIYNIDKPYTTVTFLALSFFLSYLTLKLRVRFTGYFYVAFLVILVPFFVVNGILTGSFIEGEVVWYNDQANLALRLGTIPLEDVFYAMLLLLMNVSLYEWRLQAATKIKPLMLKSEANSTSRAIFNYNDLTKR
jgi:lycopene cyclase domain-containing protein